MTHSRARPPAAASTSTTAATAAMIRRVGRLRGAAATGAGSTRGSARVIVVADARAADDRGVVTEVDVDDVRDDAGDVVRAAAAQRQLDHAVGAFTWVAVGGQR